MSARSQLDADRLSQGRAAIFSLARAAELLPLGDADARTWLRRQGLAREMMGRKVVVWGDVLDALTAAANEDAKTSAATAKKPRIFAVTRESL